MAFISCGPAAIPLSLRYPDSSLSIRDDRPPPLHHIGTALHMPGPRTEGAMKLHRLLVMRTSMVTL